MVMARVATQTKVLDTCDEKDHLAVTARHAMATKAAAGDQMARVATVRLAGWRLRRQSTRTWPAPDRPPSARPAPRKAR